MVINCTNVESKEIENVKPHIPKHFLKVPKEIILQTDLSEHRISILCYLNYNQTWNYSVHYSPTFMIQWCGYKANWRKLKNGRKNIYEKFLCCMLWLYDKEYIYNFNSEKYVQNTFQSSVLNKDKIMPPDNFGLVYDFEIEAIMNYKSPYRPLNSSILLLLLSYIRSYTWVRKTGVIEYSETTKREKPEIFHSQFKTMGHYLGIKEKMISKATRVLEEMNLIKTHRMPSYKDIDGNWHTDDIIFVCPYKIVVENHSMRICTRKQYNWEKELENGILYLRYSKHMRKKYFQE